MSPTSATVESRVDPTSRVETALLWILQIALAAVFLFAGVPKLTGAEPMVRMFDEIGVGQWFRYLTGILEVGGAILLLIPALAGVGALLLSVVMVGALLTHALAIGGSPLFAGVLLAFLWFLAWMRRERTLKLLGFTPTDGGLYGRTAR